MLCGIGRVGRVGQCRFRRSAGVAPPLDTLTGSAAAYSLRRLRTAYAGSAIRVRRSNDNAELDIGFSGNVLNAVALLDHCGANSGFVTTWYDQSGNGRNLTQATSGAQPRIVNAGVVDTSGGVPALICDAVDDFMTATSWGTIAQPFSRNAVIQLPSSIVVSAHIINTATGTPDTADVVNALSNLMQFAGSAGATQSVLGNERLVFTSIYDGASSVLVKNGSSSSAASPGTNANAGISINRNVGSAIFGGNRYQELVVFDSAISTPNRQTLERNQGLYYGITVI